MSNEVPAEAQRWMAWARGQIDPRHNEHAGTWVLGWISGQVLDAAKGRQVPREIWAKGYALYLVALERYAPQTDPDFGVPAGVEGYPTTGRPTLNTVAQAAAEVPAELAPRKTCAVCDYTGSAGCPWHPEPVAQFLPAETAEHRTRWRQIPGGPVKVRCTCGRWVADVQDVPDAERAAAKHRQAVAL